jgi:ribosomal protein L25 (general stress protein Ctc)
MRRHGECDGNGGYDECERLRHHDELRKNLYGLASPSNNVRMRRRYDDGLMPNTGDNRRSIRSVGINEWHGNGWLRSDLNPSDGCGTECVRRHGECNGNGGYDKCERLRHHDELRKNLYGIASPSNNVRMRRRYDDGLMPNTGDNRRSIRSVGINEWHGNGWLRSDLNPSDGCVTECMWRHGECNGNGGYDEYERMRHHDELRKNLYGLAR